MRNWVSEHKIVLLLFRSSVVWNPACSPRYDGTGSKWCWEDQVYQHSDEGHDSVRWTSQRIPHESKGNCSNANFVFPCCFMAMLWHLHLCLCLLSGHVVTSILQKMHLHYSAFLDIAISGPAAHFYCKKSFPPLREIIWVVISVRAMSRRVRNEIQADFDQRNEVYSFQRLSSVIKRYIAVRKWNIELM